MSGFQSPLIAEAWIFVALIFIGIGCCYIEYAGATVTIVIGAC